MFTRDVLREWTPPKGSNPFILEGELDDDVKMAWKQFGSWTRWLLLHERMKQRRVSLRTANRRWRVHNGLSLKGA